MRVGTRIKELCAALEGMGSATAAMRLDSPSANAVRRVAAAAENAVDATNALLAVLRSRMRKAPGGAL